MTKQKNIMVDMSATLIHHGHIRLLKKSSKLGRVIVGLTTDDEIQARKGYKPEIPYEYRKEMLEAFKYVDKVVPTPWLINEAILSKYNIDLLVHGSDHSNDIPNNKLKLFPRTKNISSSGIRDVILDSIAQINNQKLMLTPGPAVVLYENLKYLKPLFGRGDTEYQKMYEQVIKWIKKHSGQDEVISMQGSATLALEIALKSFVSGKVLLISSGYYSDRLEKLLPINCILTKCGYDEINSIKSDFDWVLCAYTETSTAFKLDLKYVKYRTDKLGAKLFVDATGSIGLESHHELADIMAFSSCKGLFGLTGASFVAHKSNLVSKQLDTFYFNLETQKQKKVTGPCHAIASLYGVINKHDIFKKRVINSKNAILEKYHKIVRKDNQPLLCTYLEGKVIGNDDNLVLYEPRSKLSGSVVCHFGEIHYDKVNYLNRISVEY